MKKLLAFIQILLMVSLTFIFSINISAPSVSAADAEAQVCCERDNSGNFCSYVPASQCTGKGVLQASTSCDQTSFCRPGCCAGVNGFCYNNYAKALCEKNYKGSFNSDPSCAAVEECKIGCCIIGTQAAYLTRSRCIDETSKYSDLQVDFREDVNSEQQCLNLARNTEKGCCVSEGRKCTYGAKSECTGVEVVNGTGFYANTTCSSLKNECDCAPGDPKLKKDHSVDLKATMCLPNDDRVFWKDSCGNPEGVVTENILKVDKLAALSNGNCDFNSGTQCGDSNGDGIHVCESLDCQGGTKTSSEIKKLSIDLPSYTASSSTAVVKTGERGTPKSEVAGDTGVLNGESWCEFDSPDQQQSNNLASTAGRVGMDPVGSRYYRHLCINGQELVEPCTDYRQDYCYYNTMDVNTGTTTKKYTESRCIKNEWQPCVDQCNTANPTTMNTHDYNLALQKDYECCLSPKRDCFWNGNRCGPAVSPGFKFWEGEGANICGKANTQCTAIFRCGGWNSILGACGADKGSSGLVGGLVGAGGSAALAAFLVTGPAGWAALSASIVGGLLIGMSSSKAGWQIVSGGECLSQEYLQAANNLCRSVGDCGADFNYLASYLTSSEDINLTLGTSGFSNTNSIKDELATYAKRFPKDLQDAKSNSKRGKITFGFTTEDLRSYETNNVSVPGKLKGYPKWDVGADFYNYNLPKNELDSSFKRLFTQSEIAGLKANDASGFFSGPVGMSILASVAGGIGGGIAFGKAGIGAGFSSTPVGFLVSKLVGFIAKDKAASFFGSGASLTKTVVENAGKAAENAAKIASDKAYMAVENQAIKAAEEKAKESLGDLARNEVKKSVEKEAEKAGTEAYKQTVQEAKDAATKGIGKSTDAFSSIMEGVNAAMWVYTIYQVGDVLLEDTQTVTITTTCSPWQPPVYKASEFVGGDDPCQKCNPNYKPGPNGFVDANKNPQDVRAFKVCSEYRCKSLGPTCELINKGTTEEQCVSVSKLDVSAPKIEPWTEGFTLDMKQYQVGLLPGDSNYKTGFKITSTNGTGIKIYQPFTIGLKTDEPSQCKMSFQHSKRYADMDNTFFGGNIFNYFHSNIMVYPATKNATVTGVSLTGGGHYKLYLRCVDASGNANEADYTIEFDVSNEPDLTAPNIVGSTLSPQLPTDVANQTTTEKEVYLMNGANYTAITLFVNEPAECRYSYIPLDFDYMNKTNSCLASKLDTPPYYPCKFQMPGLPSIGIGPAPSDFTSKAGMIKNVYFKCKDHPEKGYTETRNFNKDAYQIILRGSEPVSIDKVAPSGTIKTSNALVNVNLEVWTSGGAFLNGKATCKYTTDEINKENLAVMTEFLNTGSSYHVQPWSPGSGKQKFYIGCYDTAGNRAFSTIEFNVEKDTSPPVITKIYRDRNFEPPQFTVELNEAGDCKDSTEGTFDYNTGGNLMQTVGSAGTPR